MSTKMSVPQKKNAHKLRQNQFAYPVSPSSYPVMASAPPFSGSFNVRCHHLINRPYHLQQHVHQGMHICHYARLVLPMASVPYAPRPLYPGLNVHFPRMPQLMAPPLHMQYSTLVSGFLPIEIVSSSAQPFFEAHPTFTGSQPIPGLRGPTNNQMNNLENEEAEDPDLDLSLRL